MMMKKTLVVLVALVICAATAQARPMEFDEKIGHYKDLSYEALSDEGLSWEAKTRLFGGETVHYGPLTAAERRAKQKELQELLAKIDMKLVNRCEADIRKWLDAQVPQIPSAYAGGDTWKMRAAAVIFLRAYEIFGDKKYLGAGLTCADRILAKQWRKGHWPWGEYPEDWVRVQDGFNDWPFRVMLYAHKVSGDRKYFESAKRCADVLLTMQRPGGGWPDQYTFSGRPTIHTGVQHGISFNDMPTTSTFAMMVTMYHMTGDRKYIANLHKLGPWIAKAKMGEGKVVGWCCQYHDDGRPVRARQGEIELPYLHALTRGVGPLLIWLYLIDGNEAHMDLLRKAYAWHEHVRREEMRPEMLVQFRALTDAWSTPDRQYVYLPGTPGAYLPDGSNWGLGGPNHKLTCWKPVTPEQRKKYGHIIHPASLPLAEVVKLARAGKPAPFGPRGLIWSGNGNSFCEIRRALLEHKRGGREGLLKYYTGPVKYRPDQYLQARVDAAKRALDARDLRLAAMHEKGIRSVADCGSLAGAKVRWYGPKESKWGKAYEEYILREGKWPGHAAWYQWQLVYDTMLARGKIDANAAARGGRGFEAFTLMCHFDSWDVLGDWDMAVHEVENHFDVPIKGRKK